MEPETFRGKAMCMRPHEFVAGSTRKQRLPIDFTKLNNKKTDVYAGLFIKNNYFIIQIINEKGELNGFNEIAKAVDKIISNPNIEFKPINFTALQCGGSKQILDIVSKINKHN